MIFPWLFRFLQIQWFFHAQNFFLDFPGFPWFLELVGTLYASSLLLCPELFESNTVCCKIFITMFVHQWFSLIWYATWPCSEKVEFWPRPQGMGVRGWVGVCGQNICYHVAASVILFNLIGNKTMFWKSWILTFWPQPQGQGWGWEGG